MKTARASANASLESYVPRIIALGLLIVFLLLAFTGCQNASP